jgi:hypothetical protein
MKKLIGFLIVVLLGTAIGVQATETILQADSPATGDLLGKSIAISGDYMVVGVWGAESYKGYALIFKKESGVWTQKVKLQPGDLATDDRFGWSVSIDGDVAIVGAYHSDNESKSDTGAAYIFRRNGEAWDQKAKLISDATEVDQYFGHSVIIKGTLAFIGCYEDAYATDAGAVYIFENSGNDTWTKVAKLVSPESVSDAAGDVFGAYTALNETGDVLVVAAIRASNGAATTGAVYVYDKVSSSSWTLDQKLTPSSSGNDDRFSRPAIYGDRIVVGAEGENSYTGAAYIYEKNSSTGNWVFDEKITASDAATGDYFGIAVSSYADFVAVGANHKNSNTGCVYIYKKEDGNWVDKGISFSAQTGCYLGSSVYLKDDVLYSGAGGYDNSASITDSGAVFIKALTPTDTVFKFADENLASFDGTVTDTGSTAFSGGVVSGTGGSWEYAGGYNDLALVFGTTASADSRITGISLDLGQRFILEAKIKTSDFLSQTSASIDLVKNTDDTTLRWYLTQDGKLHFDVNNGTAYSFTSAASVMPNASSESEEWTTISTIVDLSQSAKNDVVKMYSEMQVEDLTSSATAISGGDSNSKDYAFDDDLESTNYWASSQTGTSVNGAAYIGCDFGANPKAITYISCRQYGNTTNDISSVVIQYSNDASTWSTVLYLALVTGSSEEQKIYIPSSTGSHRYWRLLANSDATAGEPWIVKEIEMKDNFPFNDETSPDLASTNAISGGTLATSSITRAFDDTTGSAWYSSQTGTSISGNAYIGWDFGEANKKHIRKVLITQYAASYSVSSVLVQRKVDSSSSWSTVSTVSVPGGGYYMIELPESGEAQYWRILANSNTSAGYWGIYELEMEENESPSSGFLLTALDSSSSDLPSGGITLSPASDALELLERSSNAFTLKTDYIRITSDIPFAQMSVSDFYTGSVSYVDSNSSAAISIDPTTVLRRVINPPTDFTSGVPNSGVTVAYDEHPTTPSVFHGVFEINVGLKTADFDGSLTVDIYIKKPEDTAFKKIGEAHTTDPNSDWTVHYYWNSRAAAYEWTSTDAQPYRTNGPVQFKFQVR